MIFQGFEDVDSPHREIGGVKGGGSALGGRRPKTKGGSARVNKEHGIKEKVLKGRH